MAIFLTILKIIGIILLCIIGLVLVILLYLLFGPFWFRVDGYIDREFNYNIKIKVTSFLHFLQVHVNQKKDEEREADCTIFGTLVKIFPKKEKDKSDKIEADKEDTEAIEASKDADTAKEKQAEAVDEAIESVVTDEATDVSKEVTVKEAEAADKTKDTKEPEAKPGIIDKIKAFFDKFNPKNLGEIIRNKIYEIKKKIRETIDELKDKKEKIFEILSNPENKEWLKKVLDQIVKLIKSFGINMRGTNLDFSTGSPDTTGQVCGVMSLFKPVYDKKVNILPDFQDDNFYLDGNVTIKGRIQLIFVVYFILVLYLDANTQKILKSLK